MKEINIKIKPRKDYIKIGIPKINTSGSDTDDATLDDSSKLLIGYSAYAKGTKYEGTMPNNGSVVYNPSSISQTDDAGYYSSITINPVQTQTKTISPSTTPITVEPDEDKFLSSVVVNAVDSTIDHNISSNNILNGVSILGVNGNITGDSFYKNIQVGDNLRNKTIIVSDDIVFERNVGEYILFNNNTIEDAENDGGDFIRKTMNELSACFYDTADLEIYLYANGVKNGMGIKVPNDQDYIVTYMDSSMANDFKVGYKKIDDFEFEKVSSDNIIEGVVVSGVVGNAKDVFDTFLQGEINSSQPYVNAKVTKLVNGMFSGSDFDQFKNVVSFPNVQTIGLSTFYPATYIKGLELPKLMSNTSASYIIMNCTAMKYVYAPDWVINCSGPLRGNTACETIDFKSYYSGKTIGAYNFQNASSLTRLIIRGTSMIAMTATTNNLYSSPLFTGSGCLYVLPTLVDSYKSASNWTAMSSRIYGFYKATSPTDINAKIRDTNVPVGSLIIYDDGTYETNRYTVKTEQPDTSDEPTQAQIEAFEDFETEINNNGELTMRYDSETLDLDFDIDDGDLIATYNIENISFDINNDGELEVIY